MEPLPRNEDAMKSTALGVAAALVCSMATPFAQQPSVPDSQTTPAHNAFVVTGCVQPGAAGTTTFKLTDAIATGQPAPARAGAPSAVGTSGTQGTYELRPVSGIEAKGLDADALKAQVGKRVEVVLRLIEAPAPAPATDLAGNVGAKPAEPALEKFSVTELRRVIGTCP
jgi:hypothetical protein